VLGDPFLAAYADTCFLVVKPSVRPVLPMFYLVSKSETALLLALQAGTSLGTGTQLGEFVGPGAKSV